MLNVNKQEVFTPCQEKSELDHILAAGLYGSPEIKTDDHSQYLGVPREQVLAVLSCTQAKDAAIYPEIFQALKSDLSSHLIINALTNRKAAKKYKALAQQIARPSTTVYDPAYPENISLIIASSEAAHVEIIKLEDRASRLARLGLPAELVGAAGKKLCPACLKRILVLDPREKINYKKLSIIDKLTGQKCAAHERGTK